MSRPKRPEPPPREVKVEIDGKSYIASYVVDRGVVRVTSGYGSKATQVGASSPEHIARILLRELLAEQQTR